MKFQGNTISIIVIFLSILMLTGCRSSQNLSVSAYYNYDHTAPLETATRSTGKYGDIFYEIEFSSTNHERVTGILSYPEEVGGPVPVILLVHGLGDRKEVDYIQAGERYLREAGYAVLRMDLYNHGERKKEDFDFSFEGPTRYRSREVITQSVFDLRRAVDFIESREELDAQRIGYYGISLGGIIGTILSSVDERIKVPVIALAGGRLNLLSGLKALSKENVNYFSIMDPINYVEKISPRPFLMINAENDEVIPPVTSKLLFKKARDPKKIIWFPGKHRNIPIDKAFAEGIVWFGSHL